MGASENKDRGESLILGLTGSMGSGKSFVSSLFETCRARVICADRLAHEAVRPGGKPFEEIRSTFGDSVVGPDRSLDRKHLARIVFRDPSKRKILESIVHPAVRARELELIDEYAGHPLVVLDVPLLFESGMNSHCHKTAVVWINEEEREKRLVEQRSISPQQIKERLAAQMPQQEKARRADFMIDNSGTKCDTLHQVNQLIHHLFPGELPHPIQMATLNDH